MYNSFFRPTFIDNENRKFIDTFVGPTVTTASMMRIFRNGSFSITTRIGLGLFIPLTRARTIFLLQTLTFTVLKNTIFSELFLHQRIWRHIFENACGLMGLTTYYFVFRFKRAYLDPPPEKPTTTTAKPETTPAYNNTTESYITTLAPYTSTKLDAISVITSSAPLYVTPIPSYSTNNDEYGFNSNTLGIKDPFETSDTYGFNPLESPISPVLSETFSSNDQYTVHPLKRQILPPPPDYYSKDPGVSQDDIFSMLTLLNSYIENSQSSDIIIPEIEQDMNRLKELLNVYSETATANNSTEDLSNGWNYDEDTFDLGDSPTLFSVENSSEQATMLDEFDNTTHGELQPSNYDNLDYNGEIPEIFKAESNPVSLNGSLSDHSEVIDLSTIHIEDQIKTDSEKNDKTKKSTPPPEPSTAENPEKGQFSLPANPDYWGSWNYEENLEGINMEPEILDANSGEIKDELIKPLNVEKENGTKIKDIIEKEDSYYKVPRQIEDQFQLKVNSNKESKNITKPFYFESQKIKHGIRHKWNQTLELEHQTTNENSDLNSHERSHAVGLKRLKPDKSRPHPTLHIQPRKQDYDWPANAFINFPFSLNMKKQKFQKPLKKIIRKSN